MIYVCNGNPRGIVVPQLRNDYLRQSCERDAGKKKHNHAKHRVRIVHRFACSLVRVGAFSRSQGFFMLQLCHLSVVLVQVLHLSIPSGNLSRHGKNISKSLAPTRGQNRADGSWPGALQRKIKKIDPAKESGETGETSE